MFKFFLLVFSASILPAYAQPSPQFFAKQFLSDPGYMQSACSNGRVINGGGISNFLGSTWDPSFWAATEGISMMEARNAVAGQRLAYQVACPDVW